MKKLLFAIAAMAMFAFTACTGSAEGDAAATDSVAAEAQEAPEAGKLAVPSPTGDAEADAKAVIDFMKAKIESVQTAEEFQAFEKDLTPMMQEFEKAYGEGDAKKKFDEAGEKYMKEINFNFEKAMEDWMKAHPEEMKKALQSALEEQVNEAPAEEPAK